MLPGGWANGNRSTGFRYSGIYRFGCFLSAENLPADSVGPDAVRAAVCDALLPADLLRAGGRRDRRRPERRMRRAGCGTADNRKETDAEADNDSGDRILGDCGGNRNRNLEQPGVPAVHCGDGAEYGGPVHSGSEHGAGVHYDLSAFCLRV